MTDKPPRILIYDGGEILAMCRTEFHIEGYEAAEGADCETVLALAREWGPDLIFVDIDAPSNQAWECLEALQADEQLDPILILCIGTRESDIPRAKDLGARDVLIKPVGPITLLHAVAQALDRPTGLQPPTRKEH